MIRSLSARRPSPAMIVALVALVFASAGSATAASLITGKQIRNNTITSADVKNRSLGLGDLTTKARQSLKAKDGSQGPAGPQGPQGAQGAPGVANVEIVEASSPSNSSPKGVEAECPAGKRVIGSGGAVTLVGQAYLSAVTPLENGTSVRAIAFDNPDNPNDWHVTARAICATVG